jgi:1,3-beta-glucan synthase
MSGHPQGGHYDDGYGQSQGQTHPQGQDSYYHDDQQYGQYHDDARGQQGHYQNGNDAYYDDQYVSPPIRLQWQQSLIQKQRLL